MVKDCKLKHMHTPQPIEVFSCLFIVITVKNGGKLLVNAILYTNVTYCHLKCGCDVHAGTQLRLKGYLGEETVTIGFQKGVLCVINLTSRSLYIVAHTTGFL